MTNILDPEQEETIQGQKVEGQSLKIKAKRGIDQSHQGLDQKLENLDPDLSLKKKELLGLDQGQKRRSVLDLDLFLKKNHPSLLLQLLINQKTFQRPMKLK